MIAHINSNCLLLRFFSKEDFGSSLKEMNISPRENDSSAGAAPAILVNIQAAIKAGPATTSSVALSR